MHRPCSRKTKHVRIMTAIQMNAELFRQLSIIAEDEGLMAKVVSFVKGLVTTQQKEASVATRAGWTAAAKQAHADGEDKLMAADVFESTAEKPYKVIPVSPEIKKWKGCASFTADEIESDPRLKALLSR